jgi:hypothetical protein
MYLRGSNSSSGAGNTEQLHVRRDITFCANGGSLDPDSITSAARFEYQGSRVDTDNFRCAVKGESNVAAAGTLAKPVAFYADAYCKGSATAYSFYGASGKLHNAAGVSMGTDNTPGSFQLKVKMTRNDGHVCSIQNTDTGTASSVLALRIDRPVPTATNKYITFQRGNSSPAGYIQGVPGDEWKIDFANASDRRLKSNIRDVEYGLGDLLKIKVRDYEFNGSKNTSTGFIAQELHEVWQNGVGKTDNGTDPLPASNSDDFNPWTIDYAKITPLLVKSVQDQQKIIDELTKRLEKLEQG